MILWHQTRLIIYSIFPPHLTHTPHSGARTMSSFAWVCQWDTGTFVGFFVCLVGQQRSWLKRWGLYGALAAITSDPDGDRLWMGGVCPVWGPVPLLYLLSWPLPPARLRVWDSQQTSLALSLLGPGKRLGSRIIPFDKRRREAQAHCLFKRKCISCKLEGKRNWVLCENTYLHDVWLLFKTACFLRHPYFINVCNQGFIHFTMFVPQKSGLSRFWAEKICNKNSDTKHHVEIKPLHCCMLLEWANVSSSWCKSTVILKQWLNSEEQLNKYYDILVERAILF